VFIKSLVLPTTLLVVSAASAATPPKIVFYGDQVTVNWPLPAGYINKGVPGYNTGPGSTTGFDATDAAAPFQAEVVSLHPTIVHIMVGQNDASEAHDADYQLKTPQVIAAMTQMVQAAKAANIKMIIGSVMPGEVPNTEMNEALAAFAAANGVPFISYSDVLCSCLESASTGAIAGPGTEWVPSGPDCTDGCGLPLLTTSPLAPPGAFGAPEYEVIPTATGYALMTQMAEVAIAETTGATIKGGYLQNQTLPGTDVSDYPANVNTGSSSSQYQFTPVAVFTDGSTHPLQNSTVAGSSGTWTSSNPQAVFITQTGLATALGAGTSIIKYTAPNGVMFSEWIMYIGSQP
jgi:hypothetical protein